MTLIHRLSTVQRGVEEQVFEMQTKRRSEILCKYILFVCLCLSVSPSLSFPPPLLKYSLSQNPDSRDFIKAFSKLPVSLTKLFWRLTGLPLPVIHKICTEGCVHVCWLMLPYDAGVSCMEGCVHTLTHTHTHTHTHTYCRRQGHEEKVQPHTLVA